MTYQSPNGLPGPQAARIGGYRTVRKSDQGVIFAEGGKVIKASAARDPSNTGYVTTLQPGLVMGKRTSGGAFAPSIIGLSTAALSATATTLATSAAIATEIARRQGATGTLKLTGPTTAAGTVRTATVAYSAVNVTTGDVTITAVGANAVHTLGFTGTPAGNFRLRFVDLLGVVRTTGPIVYSATPATLVTNINAAVDTALGAGLVVASGSAVTAIAITYSGAGYALLPQTLVVTDYDALTAGLVSVTNTTAGVGGFVTLSIIQPTDGSETPLSLIDDGSGMKVTDMDGTEVDQPFPLALIGGSIVAANIINYPTDASLRTWLKAQLRAVGKFVFDDDF